MEIKKYYKESNEIEDISGDYVVIKMSSDSFGTLRRILRYSSVCFKDLEIRRKLISEQLEKSTLEAEAEWY